MKQKIAQINGTPKTILFRKRLKTIKNPFCDSPFFSNSTTVVVGQWAKIDDTVMR